MTFPTKPTVGAGRIISVAQANTTATRTFPNLDNLTFNAGDRLIAIAVGYQTSTGTNAAFSGWGGGFTERADLATSTTMPIGIAEKIADGTETGTFTVTQAGTITGHCQLILMAIPGAHPSTPIEASLKANGTSANATPSGLNPSGWGTEDTLWIELIAAGETGTGGSFTGVSGVSTNYTDTFTAVLSGDVVGGVEAAVAFRHLAAAQEQPDTAFSVDTSNARHSVVTIAVPPAPPVADIAATPGVAVALGVPPSVDVVVPTVEITSVPGVGIGLASAPDVAAELNLRTPPAVGIGLSPLSTVAEAVTIAPNPAFGIAATPPPAVSSGTLVTGTIASTEGDDTADLAGATVPPDFAGTLAITEADDAADLAGTHVPPDFAGALAVTEADDTADLAGTATPPGWSGALAVIEGDDTADLAGTHVPPDFAGTLAITEADDTANLTGTAIPPSITGAMAVTEADDQAAIEGGYGLVGTIATVEGDDIADLTGSTTLPQYSGVLGVTEGEDAASLTGSHVAPAFVGELLVVEADDTTELLGSFASPVVGQMAGVEGADLVSLAGWSLPPGPWVVSRPIPATPNPVEAVPARVPHTVLD